MLSVAETARLLDRSTEQVRRYLREGVLPGRRIGRQWFVAQVDAEALRQRRLAGSDVLQHLFSLDDGDPLGDVIAIGGSGGGEVAGGRTQYLQSLGEAEFR